MSITRTIKEEDQQVLDVLREHGLEERARQYEALLRGELPVRPHPDPLPDPVPGAVTVAEATTRLNLSHKEIRRHIKLGQLETESDSATGEPLVTNASIASLLDWKRRLAVIAQPLPGDVAEPLDPDSMLGRMFAESDEQVEDDGEA